MPEFRVGKVRNPVSVVGYVMRNGLVVSDNDIVIQAFKFVRKMNDMITTIA